MKTLSCPIPSELNLLTNNGFRFNIAKIPSATYFCQEMSLPTIQLPAVTVPTMLVDYPVPGDKPTFGPLDISFLVDASMTNYKAINAWLVGLGFPEKHDQYRAFLRTFGTNLDTSPLAISQSDATLEILRGTNTRSQLVRFAGVQPVSLSGMQFVTDNTDVVYQVATAQFVYSYYYFED